MTDFAARLAEVARTEGKNLPLVQELLQMAKQLIEEKGEVEIQLAHWRCEYGHLQVALERAEAVVQAMVEEKP